MEPLLGFLAGMVVGLVFGLFVVRMILKNVCARLSGALQFMEKWLERK